MDPATRSAFNILSIQHEIYAALRQFVQHLEQSSDAQVFGPTFSWHNFEDSSVSGLRGAFQADVVAGTDNEARAWTLTISCYGDRWVIEGLFTVLSGSEALDSGEDETNIRELPQFEAASLQELSELSIRAVTELTQLSAA